MPRTRHNALMACTAALTLALALAAAPAAADVAPGRVAFSVATQVPERNVDAGGAGPTVALPGGGAVMVAYDPGADLTLVQLRADGSRDPAFGNGGIARIALPGTGRFNPAQLLREPGGRLLVVGAGFAAADRFELPRFALVRLTAAGAPDPSFGTGGIAPLDLQSSCGGGGCAAAALAPDGSIVITGQVGRFAPGIATNPDAGSSMQWVVRRLTAVGATDPSFGTVPVSGPAGVATSGYATVVRPSGAIVLLGIRDGRPHLAGLTAAGAPDPSFNGGQLAPVPVDGVQMLLRSDGAIDIAGRDRLVRFTSAGVVDPTYGTAGTVAFSGFNPHYGPPAMLATPDGGAILSGLRSFEPTPAAQPRLQLQRVTPGGTLGTAGTLSPAFGGGIANRRSGVELNSFRGGLVARPDGSYLAVGAVSVVRYTGEGEGFSAGFVAVAALTPLFAPDPAFGGPQRPARARVTVPRQRARSAAQLRRVLARVTTSGPGLVLLRVRDGRGRVLAQDVTAVYAAGRTTVRIPLMTTGRRVLRRGRSSRVLVGRDFRDILTARDRGVISARLR